MQNEKEDCGEGFWKAEMWTFLYTGDMWPSIKEQFSRQKVRADIVKKMFECGIRVDEHLKLYVGDVEIDYAALARAVDVDRRVVQQTAKQIRQNDYLFPIFSKLAPAGASLVNVVSRLGYTAVVVEADQRASGVMAAVAKILASHGMVIRQAFADDPDMVPDAKLTLVVEGQLTAKAIEELNSLDVLRSIKIVK
jgi:uncharacterized protein